MALDEESSSENDCDVTIVERMNESSSTNQEDLDATLTDQPSIKKRGAKISVRSENTDKILEELRRTVREAFRGAYQAEDENVEPYVNQVKAAYIKYLKSYPGKLASDFFGELTFRLNFMVENTTNMQRRRNVYKMLVITSLQVFIKNKKLDILEFIKSYCERLYMCEESSVRLNVCSIIGIVFSIWQITDGNDDSVKNGLPVEIRDKLYEILIRRLLDKIGAVRAEVVRACKTFQDVPIPSSFKLAVTRGPKDIIHLGLQDFAPECRLAAVETMHLNLKCKDHVNTLIDISTCDRSNKVRIYALQSLSNVKPLSLEKKQLMDLLPGVIFDVEKTVRMSAKSLILKSWLTMIAESLKKKMQVSWKKNTKKKGKTTLNLDNDMNHGLGAAAYTLLSKLSWVDEPELVSKILFVVLDTIRQILGKGRKLSVADLMMSFSYDCIEPTPIMRTTYKELLDPNMDGEELALKCFFWRCLVQYSSEKCHSETPKSVEVQFGSCLHRLAPTLIDMCEVAREIKTIPLTREFSTGENEISYMGMKQIALCEVLKLMKYLERDSCGLEKWQAILEEMITDFTLKKIVTDEIADILVRICFPNDPIGALDIIISTAAYLEDRNINPDQTLLEPAVKEVLNAIEARVIVKDEVDDNSTVKGVNAIDFSQLPFNDDGIITKEEANENTVLLESEIIHGYGLQLMSSIMRTGAYTYMHPFILNKYETLQGNFRFRDASIRLWTVQCAGIITSLTKVLQTDSTVAFRTMYIISKAVSIECLQVKLACLDTLIDSCITYGFENMVKWIPDFPFPHLLTTLLHSEEPLVALKAAECGAKLLLLTQRKPSVKMWISLTASLLAKLFHTSSAKDPIIKAALSQFFIAFSTNRRSNQQLLVNSFWEIVDLYQNADENILFNPDCLDVRKCLHFICRWARESLLLKKADEGIYTEMADAILMQTLLDRIEDNIDQKDVDMFCECLSLISPQSLEPDQLLEFTVKIYELYEEFADLYGDRSKMVCDLKRIGKKFIVRCESLSDHYGEDTHIPQFTAAFRKRNTTSRKPKNKEKEKEGTTTDGEFSEGSPPDAPEPQRTTAKSSVTSLTNSATRTRPTRAAKTKAGIKG